MSVFGWLASPHQAREIVIRARIGAISTSRQQVLNLLCGDGDCSVVCGRKADHYGSCKSKCYLCLKPAKSASWLSEVYPYARPEERNVTNAYEFTIKPDGLLAVPSIDDGSRPMGRRGALTTMEGVSAELMDRRQQLADSYGEGTTTVAGK